VTPLEPDTNTDVRSRLAISAAIAVACVLQAPGRIVADTKIDLAVAPARFLGRALHLWQPEWAFGQLQNQAVGYLIPMGPFFLAGDLARVPMWAVQRAWLAAVLIVSFWGVVRVADRLHIGQPSSRLIAGAAYALSPAMLALVGSTSGGQVPAAVLPWVLLPLIDGAERGSPRRAAARSALAVVAMGAVNAGSTLAALPLAGLWLVTRTPGPRRRRLIGWWVALIGVATLWWTVALALQSRYGFDFVPFTERADVTTGTTSAVEVLRGTGYWLSSLFTRGPWLPAGWMLASHAVVIGATVALTAAGFYGLARRDMHERTFLIAGVALGVAVIAAGYAGPSGSPLSSVMRTLLDGVLSPIRNLHKFEPTLRLPLALGLAHAVVAIPAVRWRPDRRLVAGLAAGAVVIGALPLMSGRLLQEGSFSALPSHWRQAAAWLDARSGARSLVVPASEFGEYRWGRPLDEPLQPLSAGAWATRNLIPLGSVGATRVLDALERRIETGDVDGLAAALDRSGVRYLVVRNDLDPRRTTAPRPPVVRAVLGAALGLRRVAAFGPVLPDRPTSDRLHPWAGVSDRVRAVEIYEVDDAGPPVRAIAAPAAVLSGGPESAVDVPGLGDLPVVLAGDEPQPNTAAALLTDGLRLRDVDYGTVRDNVSYVLTAREPAPDPGPHSQPKDQVPVAGPQHRTAAVMTGAAVLSASSYGPSPPRIPEGQPFAAFDDDPSSGWVPTTLFGGLGQWLQITLDASRSIPYVDIRPLRGPGWRTTVTQVHVSTERGVRRVKLRGASEVQRVRLPAGSTRAVRVTISGVTGQGTAGAGLAEVVLPGVEVRRPLAVPDDQRERLEAGAPVAGVHLRRSRVDPFDATRRDEETRIDRWVRTARPTTLELSGTAVARPGVALDDLMASLGTGTIRVTTSSVWFGQPAYRGEGALDGDTSTAWVAGADDEDAQLTMEWDEPRTVEGITVHPARAPTRTPSRVRLSTATETREVDITGQRPARFEPLVTNRLTLTVLARASAPRATRGLLTPVATAIGELELMGVTGPTGLQSAAVDPQRAVQLPCGAGPAVLIDGIAHRTTAEGTVGDLLLGRQLAIAACEGALTLPAGRHRVETTLTGPLALNQVDLVAPGPAIRSEERSTTVTSWNAETRSVRVAAGPTAVLTTNENWNEGWQATLAGQHLTPLRIDGWRQAWVVPGGSGGQVELAFAPGRSYRAGLVAGAIGVLAALICAFARRRGRELPPAPARAVPVVVIGALAAFAVWAVSGAVVVALPVLVFLAMRTDDDRVLPEAAALTYAGAGLLVVLQPGRFPGTEAGAYGAPAQVLAGVALAALVATLLVPQRR
jgi:arabinofuranan 3-O-arabinosyltransferase